MFSSWILLSLAAPFLWAIGNIGDRVLSEKLIRNEYAVTFVVCLVRLPIALLLFAVTGWYVPPLVPLLLVLLAGFLFVSAFVFYFRAMRTEEPSRVMLLNYSVGSLVTFFLGMIFLGERFSVMTLVGALFLFSAGILSIIKFQKHFFEVRRGLLWILGGACIWPVTDILLKYLTGFFPSMMQLLAWSFIGGFLGGFLLLLFPFFRRKCRRENFQWPALGWKIYWFNTVIFTIGYLSFIEALNLERVSLTVLLSSTQPLFVFFMEWMVSRFAPQYGVVDTSLASVLPKAAALGAAGLGIWLLSV